MTKVFYVTAKLEGHTVYFRADSAESGLNWTADEKRARCFQTRKQALGYASDLLAIASSSYDEIKVESRRNAKVIRQGI